jgi:hypothetical protein
MHKIEEKKDMAYQIIFKDKKGNEFMIMEQRELFEDIYRDLMMYRDMTLLRNFDFRIVRVPATPAEMGERWLIKKLKVQKPYFRAFIEHSFPFD